MRRVETLGRAAQGVAVELPHQFLRLARGFAECFVMFRDPGADRE